MKKQAINLVWLKRDLRLRDHGPLAHAAKEGLPTLIFYCFEPSLEAHSDYAPRHWRFIYESLRDLQVQLAEKAAEIHLFHNEVLTVLGLLKDQYDIKNLYSHLEVGLKITFDRDKAVKDWCATHGLKWQEFGQDAVIRGQKHRDNWQDGVEKLFTTPPVQYDIHILNSPSLPLRLEEQLKGSPLPHDYVRPDANFQPGGESYAWKYFYSFLKERSQQYSRQLSNPTLSRRSCSRLSPYLAYGNISVREVFQQAEYHRLQSGNDFNLRNFRSRLYWRCHYMQKLESGHYLEHAAINPALDDIGRSRDEARLSAFLEARTGFPMVDASLRCLEETGWINFRMRAMLVTFTSFALWLDWKPVATHLAQLFLDFEPGIHYPQIQMQAGLTGYHTLRIFNPHVQAKNHDPEGAFIHRWLPELQSIPPPLCLEPWKMTKMEQTFYRCTIGQEYPAPIVDYDEEVRKNKDRYWRLRHRPAVQAALPQVWRQFCVREDIKKYKQKAPPTDISNY